MRVVLNPSGVKALIESDPEAFVEMKQNAIEQVAEAIKRKVTQADIEKQVSGVIDRTLTQGYYSSDKTLKPEVSSKVDELIQKRVHQLLDGRNDAFLQKEATKAVAFVFESHRAALVAKMEGMAEQIIREKFASMFGK